MRCCTAFSTRWSTTIGRRSTSSKQRLDEVEKPGVRAAGRRTTSGGFSSTEERRRLAAPRRHAAARRGQAAWRGASSRSSAEPMSYRFRDVYDHLVRLTEDANIFHDRVTGILDAHLSFTSNRLNQVMKVLTIISTIFMPMTVLTGMCGMNVTLPHFPGGEHAQFWWIVANHGGDHRADCCSPSTGSDGGSMAPVINVSAAASGESDRRGRGGRTAGVGRQGAGRELDRRRRAPRQRDDRTGRQTLDRRSKTTASA